MAFWKRRRSLGPVRIEVNSEELAALHPGRLTPALRRALFKAGMTALRDMRAESTKRIRARKRLRVAPVREALILRRPKGAKEIDGIEWAVDVRGTPVPLVSYPHRRTRKGISVTVNRGKRTLVKGAFLATVTRAGGLGGSEVKAHAGHLGIFKRIGADRLPIRKLLGSRPVDALLHKGEAEAVQLRGARSLSEGFYRLLPLELEKARARAAKGGGA